MVSNLPRQWRLFDSPGFVSSGRKVLADLEDSIVQFNNFLSWGFLQMYTALLKIWNENMASLCNPIKKYVLNS